MTSVLSRESGSAAPPLGTTRTQRFRDAVHAGACVLAGVLIIVGGLLMPVTPDDSSAAALFPVIEDGPGRFYAAHLLFALGLVLLAAVGLAVLRLTPHRGGVPGTISGFAFIVAGISAGAGIWAFGAITSSLAANGGEAGRSAWDSLEDSEYVASAFWLGFPPLLLGFLLGGLALWRSGAVPRWVPVALALGILAPVVGEDGVLGALTALPMAAAFVGIAAALMRRHSPGDVPDRGGHDAL